MKLETVLTCVVFLLVAACAPLENQAQLVQSARILVVEKTPTPTSTSIALDFETPTVAASNPTPTQHPTEVLSERQKVLNEHEIERVTYLLDQGPAKTIPAMEFHGDNYYMVFGKAVVELSPEAFEKQMKWFRDNQFHAVTPDELISWLNGTMELPKKSVILTFDLGAGHYKNRQRVVDVFETYKMFGIFTIQTYNMDSEDLCPNDACWEAFRNAYASGYVSIGSHTIYHGDFALVSSDEGLRELALSKQIIEENIGQGCVVNVMTWPFESIPTWGPLIKSVGFEAAFGGSTYQISSNATQLEKPDDFYQLPRVFPPNSDGFSRRPNDMTLEEMMKLYTD